MGQMAIGLLNEQNMTSAQEPLTAAGEELDTVDIGKQLERVKWFLWHGNVVRALDTIEDIENELDLLPQNSESRKKLLKAVREFRGYIEANQNFIPNYGGRLLHLNRRQHPARYYGHRFYFSEERGAVKDQWRQGSGT
jgi:hypothetical protein